MATTRTDGTDASKNVREQMLAEKRRRANQPKPSTVVSDDAAVQGNKAQGGPNPNEEGLPVRFTATLEAPDATEQAKSDTTEALAENLSDQNKGEVYEKAQGLDIKGRSNMDRDELVEAVSESQAENVDRPNGVFGGQKEWYTYRLANGYTAAELSDDDGEPLGRNALRDLDDR